MVITENCIVEIVRPGTSEMVEDGEVGEVVVTTLNRSYPLIRFATGDLSAIVTNSDSSGIRTNKRLKGWMGRADQTTKVRGMFVHPKQVANIVSRFSAISKARAEVSNIEGKDHFEILCESSDKSNEFSNEVKDAVRAECRIRADIVFVEPNSLANDGKVIDDKRDTGAGV